MNKAFTLVELAIVIVIIGLLVSGVLAGQELIKQAKIRSQIKQLQGYDAATLTFRSKYAFLPGDLPSTVAPRYNFITATVASGASTPPNGDGIITDQNGNIPTYGAWAEPRLFFMQLKQANLINTKVIATAAQIWDLDVVFPSAEIGIGGISVATLTDRALYYFLGPNVRNDTTTNNSSFPYLASAPSLTPEEASSLDEKLDDGNPSAGNVKAVTSSLTPEITLSTCLGATNTVYNLISSNIACRLAIKAAAN